MIVKQNRLDEARRIELIYKQYDLIVKKLRRKGVPYYDAPDFAVEIMLKAAKAVHQLRDEEKLEAWMGRIVDNSLKKYYAEMYLKREMETAIVETIADICTVESAVEEIESKHDLARIIAGLNKKEYAVFMMRHVEERKFREIAVILNINENTARSIYSRSCNKLRQKIKREDFSCFFTFFEHKY